MIRPIGARVALVLVALLFAISGCIKAESYVDPSYRKATYGDLTRRADPAKWRVVVEFFRQGERYPAADATLLGTSERVVRASGIAVPTAEPGAPEFKVVVNNFGDHGDAAAKGFGTGLTLGLAGTTVTDNYEMDVVLTQGGKSIRKSGYKHALHTTIGNASGPPGLTPMTPSDGFAKIVEDLLLNALKDLEQDKDAAPFVGTGA